jgi:hypothetical protein
MKCLSKSLTLLLAAALAVSSLVLVQSVFAQTKPSVPEFSLRYIDYSYDTPNVFSIDQYTGEKVVTRYGEHFDKRTIEIKIKNQLFTPYKTTAYGEEQQVNVYYNVRVKGPYGTAWTELFGDNIKFPVQDYSSQYTIINFTNQVNGEQWELPHSGQVEIQVQASIGVLTASRNPSTGWMDPYYFYGVAGENSSWSPTQTFDMASNAPLPTAPEFPATAILPLFIVIPLFAAILIRKFAAKTTVPYYKKR